MKKQKSLLLLILMLLFLSVSITALERGGDTIPTLPKELIN